MRQFAMAILAMAMALSTPARAQSVDTPRFTRCADALIFYVPGDYYFCVGAGRQLAGHPKIALDYFERAAGWGHKKAQYLLGLMHFQGDGTPVNRPLGLAWLTLAAEREDRDMEAARAFALRNVSELERTQAEQLLAAMRPIYADSVTVERAAKRFARETRTHREDASRLVDRRTFFDAEHAVEKFFGSAEFVSAVGESVAQPRALGSLRPEPRL